MLPIACIDKLVYYYLAQGEYSKAYKTMCVKINESSLNHLLVQFEFMEKLNGSIYANPKYQASN
jgi:hypothetical protein